MRRIVAKTAVQAKNMAVSLYRAEMAARKIRLAQTVKLSPAGRPMCQYCGIKEAHHTGQYRSDGSARLRKTNKIYICMTCHYQKYNIPTYFGRKNPRDNETLAY